MFFPSTEQSKSATRRTEPLHLCFPANNSKTFHTQRDGGVTTVVRTCTMPRFLILFFPSTEQSKSATRRTEPLHLCFPANNSKTLPTQRDGGVTTVVRTCTMPRFLLPKFPKPLICRSDYRPSLVEDNPLDPLFLPPNPPTLTRHVRGLRHTEWTDL